MISIRSVKPGDTYSASDLPECVTSKGTVWLRTNMNIDYSITLLFNGMLEIEMFTWDDKWENYTRKFIDEKEITEDIILFYKSGQVHSIY